jgi:hypothetical protein
MSQWLSTGVGLGESHCDIKCFIYGICSSTNIITTIAIHSESRLKLWNSIFGAQKVAMEGWMVIGNRKSATNIVIKHFPWKTTDIKYVYCIYVVSMDTNNNTPRNTPNSDTSKGSIVERRRVGSRKQYNGQMISVSGVTKFNCDGQGWMTFWASVGAKYDPHSWILFIR